MSGRFIREVQAGAIKFPRQITRLVITFCPALVQMTDCQRRFDWLPATV